VRRANNIDYRAVIDRYNAHTLKLPGHAAAYVNHALSTIKPRMDEFISPKRRRRRLLRFRQRQYTYDDIAKLIVFDNVHQSIHRLGVKEAKEIFKEDHKKEKN